MNDLETKKQELLEQLEDIQKQINAQQKIRPVFLGGLGDLLHDESQDEAFAIWQKARARVIEKINIVNNGDNGFKAGEHNYRIYLVEHGHKNKNSKLSSCGNTRTQDAEPMVYIRTWEAAQELLKDPQFCEDMRTYFKGWL